MINKAPWFLATLFSTSKLIKGGYTSKCYKISIYNLASANAALASSVAEWVDYYILMPKYLLAKNLSDTFLSDLVIYSKLVSITF